MWKVSFFVCLLGIASSEVGEISEVVADPLSIPYDAKTVWMPEMLQHATTRFM